MLTYNNWTFTWNAENRLIVASNSTTVVTYAYDYQGRRFMKTVSENGSLTKDLRFVYYNYLQIAQEDQLQVGSEKQRVWDPSGALLMVRQNNTSYFTCFDGNKNISDYVDSNGSVVAHYEYSPFGQITSATGSLKDDFEYRFSSEYSDSETGFVYYNFRYYNPKLARWLSLDPIEERGGWNLYVFVGNDGVGRWDEWGLKDTNCCSSWKKINCEKLQLAIDRIFKMSSSIIYDMGDLNKTFDTASLMYTLSLVQDITLSVASSLMVGRNIAKKGSQIAARKVRNKLGTLKKTKFIDFSSRNTSKYINKIPSSHTKINVSYLYQYNSVMKDSLKEAGRKVLKENVAVNATSASLSLVSNVLDPLGGMGDSLLSDASDLSKNMYDFVKRLQQRAKKLIEIREKCCE